jgi:hypothetical protein
MPVGNAGWAAVAVGDMTLTMTSLYGTQTASTFPDLWDKYLRFRFVLCCVQAGAGGGAAAAGGFKGGFRK